jgi:hypothetical protein
LANGLQDLISKIIRPKWTGGVVQEVEHLHSKHEALCSNPSTGKKKKKKETPSAESGSFAQE